MEEMRIADEDLRDSHFLHYDHRRKVHKRDLRLVIVLLPQFPCPAKLLRRDVNNLDLLFLAGVEYCLHEGLSLYSGQGVVQVRDRFAQDIVARDITTPLDLK